MADDLNMNETDREKILYTNAKKLFIGGSE
jgi:predicted TIM-barrel fold metal-dependent hydrolase